MTAPRRPAGKRGEGAANGVGRARREKDISGGSGRSRSAKPSTWRAPAEATNRDLALDFVRCFSQGDVDGLLPLLDEELRFRGPLFEFDCRDDYLAALRSDPLDEVAFRLLAVTDDEEEDTVAVFWVYEKVGSSLTIAQLFKFGDRRIREIVLVFDTRGPSEREA